MKREPFIDPLEYHYYGKYKTFFTWCKCEVCGLEFRREDGWWIQAVNYKMCPQKMFDKEYICGDCIKTEEVLIEYLKAVEQKWNTPPKR